MAVQTVGRDSKQAVESLWHEYKRTGDVRARDRLVLTLAPLVKYIVYRKIREIPAHFEADDFISSGLVALIGAIDRWNPERGTTLEQFAWTRIHGAVLDELRRHDWAPRSLRRWQREMERARANFTALYGRPPREDEIASALGLTVSAFRSRIDDLARAEVGSLNVPVTADDEDGLERIDTIASRANEWDPEHAHAREQALDRFHAAVSELSEREQMVVLLTYSEGLTLREIGEVLGISDSRVCQIHGRAKSKLRIRLADEAELLAAVS